MAERNIPSTGVTPSLPTEDDTLTLPEARECIKTKFATYHKLLDEKESELLAELELLEEELDHVRSNLVKLRGVVESFDKSLVTNSLNVSYGEKEKSLWLKQIQEIEDSENKFSHLTLDISDENFAENLIGINPNLSKAKFRSQLAPLLELEPQLREEWYVVSIDWFYKFSNSINLINPQPNDKWEFPVKIPIQTTNDVDISKLLHSTAWDMLLAFNGLSPDSIPIKRQSYLNETTNKIEIPTIPIRKTKHNCTIGHSGEYNRFSSECEIKMFPHETYEDLLEKLSGFSTLLTDHPPFLYTFDEGNTIPCSPPRYTDMHTVRMLYRRQRVVPIQDTKSSIGATVRSFLLIIPNSTGHIDMQVREFWNLP
eukprot:TRINITY_DN2855_c0_g1_i9.p1 TRINITY_DN2855_c0_g1~~TRINITY_DN2855_c0_g1_i9.p1  ORF type:complete len:369 (+),score=70.49 TRINITY_DN2855_c0_g1_i9:65-1171(+)